MMADRLSIRDAIDRAGPILYKTDWIGCLDLSETNILAKYGPRPHGRPQQSIGECPERHRVALDRAIGKDFRLGVQRATVLDWIYAAGVMSSRNHCDPCALDQKLELSKTEKNPVGAPPVVRHRVIRQMLHDLQSGKLTADELRCMKQETMEQEYKASRKVCKEARIDALADAKVEAIL
jgi:hypothetical protein